MAETTTAIKDFRILRLLLPLLWRQADRGLRRRLVAGMVLILATAALGAAAPVLFKRLVDACSGAPAPSPVMIPVMLIAADALAQWLCRTVAELRWFTYGRFEQSIQRRLALLMFDHIHRLSLRFDLGRRTGGLQQTLVNGLLGYRPVLFHGLFVVLPLAVELALVGAVLIGICPPIFLVVVLATAALYVVSFVIGVEQQRAPQPEATNAYIDAFARSAAGGVYARMWRQEKQAAERDPSYA